MCPASRKSRLTSELLDWIKLLLVEDVSAETLRQRDPAKLIPPLYGALLKNEQDVQLFERLAFLHRREGGDAGGSAKCSKASCSSCATAKPPVSLKEFLDFDGGAEARASPAYRVDDFYYLARATLVKDERHLDKFDRVFGHHFKGLENLADDAHSDSRRNG